MLIRGKQPRTSLARRAVPAVVLVAALVACGLSFVAGGHAYRQGTFHTWKERALAALHPVRRVQAWAEAPEPETLTLDIRFKHWRKLEERRERALDDGLRFGEEMDAVPATLTTGEGPLDVRLRLRGRALDHFQGRKWSFRVETRGDDAFHGMRRFNLQHPGTRGYEREWLFHRLVRADGGLGLRYEFVRLLVNGEDWGLYAVEEHFSKELLESQQRREGPIVRFDDSDRLERKAEGLGDELVRNQGDYASTPLDTYQTRRIDGSPALAAERELAVRLFRDFATGERSASQVFDVAGLARLVALSEVFGTWHPLAFHNTRFYYDPVAARLEPIAHDANSCLDGRFTLNALAVPWLRAALRDEAFGRAYVSALLKMSDPDWLRRVQSELGPELGSVALLLSREWPIEADDLWGELERRQGAIREALDRGTLLQGFVAASADAPGTYELQLYNNTNLPVEVEALEVEARVVALAEPIVVPPAPLDSPPTAFRTSVRLPATPGPRVHALCRFAGADSSRRSTLEVRTGASAGRPAAPNRAECIARHPFLSPDEDGGLRVPPGTWAVEGDLVLPDETALHIDAGATLRFAPGAVLLATGPIMSAGSAEAPVRLVPAGETWGGIVVIDAPPSRWTHTLVADTTGIERGGWRTTGGVNFQAADIDLHTCRFERHRGEDALNVVRAAVHFEALVIVDAASDAFDGDFVTGVLRDCTFERIAGDAVDVSGSAIDLHRINVRDVGDKAVSAGERSRVVVAELDVLRGGIGVASKDASSVHLRDAWIAETHTALAAYRKKPEYGPARIDAAGLRLRAVAEPALAQTRSEIVLDGRRVEARAVDVDRLYADGSPGS